METSSIINTKRIQYIAVSVSLLILFFVIELIRRKKIREDYSLIWFVFGIIFVVFSLWRNGLDIVSRILGIAYPPAAIFLILLMAVFALLIHYSIIITRLSESNKILAQAIGIIELELRRLKKERPVGDESSKNPGSS